MLPDYLHTTPRRNLGAFGIYVSRTGDDQLPLPADLGFVGIYNVNASCPSN
jgi:hypothetical protein